MRSLRLLYLGLTAAFAVLQWLSVAPAAPLDDLIAAAKKEGALDFYGPSTLRLMVPKPSLKPSTKNTAPTPT
jgi:hypothetical protein